MAYLIEPHEAPAEGLRRIARECFDGIEHALSDVDSRVNEAVHEGRKQLKALRALIRLVRPVVGGNIYRVENHCYRDAGRLLAPFRDAWVQVELIEKLIDLQEVGERATEALEVCASDLRSDYEKAIARGKAAEAAEEVSRMLAEARGRVPDWPIDDVEGFELFRPGLEKVYRRGREGLRRALIDPSVENLHEWRKRCKYLRHQMEVLTPAWPSHFKLAETSLHELTDLLGDDHDLAVLRETLREGAGDVLSAGQLAAIHETLEVRHRQFIDRAFPLGRRHFAEKPKPFARRLAVYWGCNATPQS